MAFCTIFILFLCAFAVQENVADNNFNAYYSPQWGRDHLSIDAQGTQVQLKMDRSSGAGFRSKLDYGAGLFHIRMKIPDRKTEGIVTAFYLISINTPQNHYEVDYEFLGTNGTLQTNVFANDTGNREQKFKLWFDPTKDFHTYEILWNSRQIVFVRNTQHLGIIKGPDRQSDIIQIRSP
ncbi:Xyloglucan:xyloglucosyl transferase [Handroanthus impetiginosus]|uniref:Xyloglucan:xyloglucosyl transferase n=1 Tax=Handroanthus impetiginosus TaxID=429701 RepID=A0A2G9G7X2_9LAMI|nr:Xyloglucan:xyloglucosyl transferase [Handroanthus impetiginosus]